MHVTHSSVPLQYLSLVLAWLLAGLWPVLVANAQAAPSDLETTRSAQTVRYVERLLGEINLRREQAGVPTLTLAPESANVAADRYLADLTPPMLGAGICNHGAGSPARYGWDYVAETGFAGAGRGEVIACPDTTGYWTPARLAQSWWDSPVHQRILYADPRASLVACGTYGLQRDGAAYQTVACVTYAES